MKLDLSSLDLMLPEPDPNAKEKMIARCASAPTAYENWAPAVAKAGVSAPDTIAMPMCFELQEAILEGMEMPPEAIVNLVDIVKAVEIMGDKHGFPLFIKTSFTSNKHEWVDTCCLASAEPKAVLEQLANIVGYQGFSPYPVSPSLLIRQMLDTDPAFRAFNGMPVTQEFRFFAGKGKVEGYQAYWPEHTIQNPDADDWQSRLAEINSIKPKDLKELVAMAMSVTRHLDGDWSIDFLKDRYGKWWLIDMAEGAKSYRSEVEFKSLVSNGQETGPSMG